MYWICLAVGLGVGWEVGFAIYSHRGQLIHWQMDNKQEVLWNLILKAVSGYLAIIGAVIAAFKYLDERAEHSEAALRESKKGFLDKRQDVYFRLGEALAEIMNHDPGDGEWVPAKMSFYKLYWGEISLVSDKAVTSAVEDFQRDLDKVEDSMAKENLAPQCVAIMQECRKSLGDMWNVDQGKINDSGLLGAFSGYFKKN
jgi:hypothetical protein